MATQRPCLVRKRKVREGRVQSALLLAISHGRFAARPPSGFGHRVSPSSTRLALSACQCHLETCTVSASSSTSLPSPLSFSLDPSVFFYQLGYWVCTVGLQDSDVSAQEAKVTQTIFILTIKSNTISPKFFKTGQINPRAVSKSGFCLLSFFYLFILNL